MENSSMFSTYTFPELKVAFLKAIGDSCSSRTVEAYLRRALQDLGNNNTGFYRYSFMDLEKGLERISDEAQRARKHAIVLRRVAELEPSDLKRYLEN